MTGKNLILFSALGLCLAGGLAHLFIARPVVPLPSPPAGAGGVPSPMPTPARARPAVQSQEPKASLPVPDAFQSILVLNPEDSDAQAAAILVDLCRAGQFQAAFQLVTNAPAGVRPGFYRIIFNRWAQCQPQEAVRALDAIADPSARSAAWQAAADGWNVNDPAGLAAYAYALPAGGDRDYALGEALSNWSLQDPAALGEWLNTVPRGSEYDGGVALMLSRSDGVNRPPELAMAWVENISDPVLRQKAFQRVITEWAQTDEAAARQYVAAAPWLEDSQRVKILDALAPSSLKSGD